MFIWNWIVEGFFYTDLILSFFHSYHDPERNVVVKDFKKICKHYLGGWFIIDSLAVFPFHLIFSAGLMLKLFRLARIPRLLKLLDPQKFKRMLIGLDGLDPSINQIMRRDINMFIYNIFNLVLMMLFLVYGIGCLFYLVSTYITLGSDETFITAFKLHELDDSDTLIRLMYFALTMLSTVGYGDYFPIHKSEMFMSVLLMLMGVGVFSWITSELRQVIL